MITPNNFKEIRITPNEDNTLKVEFYGVVFQGENGEHLETAIVTYPRVKIDLTSMDFFSTKKLIGIEVLPDNNQEKQLEIIYIPEEK